MDINVSRVLKTRYGIVGAPGVVGHDGMRRAVCVCDQNGANQCRGTSGRFVLDLDREDVALRVKSNAVLLTLLPSIALSNVAAVDPQSIFVVASNDNFRRGSPFAKRRGKVITEVAELMGRYL